MQQDGGQTKRNTVALALYMVTLATGGFVFAGALLAGGAHAPWLASGAIRAGLALLTTPTAALLIGPSPWRNPRQALSAARRFGAKPKLLVALTSTADIALVAMAANLIDPAVAMAIIETHPIGAIFLGWMADPKQRIWKRDTGGLLRTVPLMLGCLFLTATAEAGGATNLASLADRDLWRILAGIGLALLGALTISTTSLTATWVHETAQTLGREHPDLVRGISPSRLTAGTLCTGYAAVWWASSIMMIAAGTAMGERWSAIRAAPLLGATATLYTSSITWRMGMVLSSRIEMNALLLLAGPAAIAVQRLTGVSETARLDYLAAGMACALAANIILGLRSREPERAAEAA